MLARRITLPQPFPTKLTPLLPYPCRLFVALKKVNPFGIKQIQPLFAKHPGWGVVMPWLATRHSPLDTSSLTPFRINTYESVTKQATLTTFRINTYKKQGEGGAKRSSLTPRTSAYSASLRYLYIPIQRQTRKAPSGETVGPSTLFSGAVDCQLLTVNSKAGAFGQSIGTKHARSLDAVGERTEKLSLSG